MIKNALHSEKLLRGKRNYFADLHEAENGKLYLKITESTRDVNGYNTKRLIIFEEDINGFAEIIGSILNKFQTIKGAESDESSSSYSIKKIRENHTQAYKPWTSGDDSKLEMLFCEGKRVVELTQIFGRNEGAIISRIKKLELNEKYN